MSKNLYVLLLLPALFIDGLQAAITFGLFAIPGVGEVLAPAVDVSLSFSMGAGLLMLMALNGLLYWQFILPGFIAEAVPFFDSGPFWTIMVGASILKKRSEEGDAIGMLAGVAASSLMPQSNLQGAAGAVASMGSAIGQNQNPPQTSPQAQDGNTQEPAERASALQLSRTMDSDIKPAQKPTVANDNERTPRTANDNLIDVDGRGRTAYAA